jgi:hypothetical protein
MPPPNLARSSQYNRGHNIISFFYKQCRHQEPFFSPRPLEAHHFHLWYNLLIIYLPDSPKASQKSVEDETFHKKYVLVKSLDEATFKMGIFDKVEIGTTDRVGITLNMRDPVAYELALKFMPQFKEVGFKVLRLKYNKFDRYEDHKIE